MKKLLLKLTLLLFLLFSPFNFVLATGGLILHDSNSDDENHLYQITQKALIVYDDGKEDLYLKTSYKGEINKFIWLIPTPGYPEINEISNNIFEELESFYEEENNSELIKEKKLNILETRVLSGTETNNIFTWLNDNDYKITLKVKEIIDWYIEKEWYFTVVQVNPNGLSDENYIQPIKLSFDTDAIVYPMKISKILTLTESENLDKVNNLKLYVLTDKSVKAPCFYRPYSNKICPMLIKDKEVETNYDFDALRNIINKKYILNVMHRNFSDEEIDEDIYFVAGGGEHNPLDKEIVKLSESYKNNEKYKEEKEKVCGAAKANNLDMMKRLEGRIILKVEDKGKAYYINPNTNVKRYLGRPNDAFKVMREEGIGITNANLEKIPVADDDESNDEFYDYNFVHKHKGSIFLQVEENGEAWYLNPEDGKRYFLGKPEDAFNVMRELGLGISNENFNKLK